MNLVDVKEKLCYLTELFFESAVIWSEQMNTRPSPPFVELKCGPISRTAYPVVDASGKRIYHASTTFEVNLYTKGFPIRTEENTVGNYVNTASSDLMDFANFLESDVITDLIAGWGMSIILNSPVRDLTELQNDRRYCYRAMAEFSVSFAQESGGPYGLRCEAQFPNSSGGGTEEQANEEDYVIEEVEIEEGKCEK